MTALPHHSHLHQTHVKSTKTSLLPAGTTVLQTLGKKIKGKFVDFATLLNTNSLTAYTISIDSQSASIFKFVPQTFRRQLSEHHREIEGSTYMSI